MKPGLFYPFALLIVLALLGGALYPGVLAHRDLQERIAQVEARGYVFEDERLNGFKRVEGVDFLVNEGGAFQSVRLIALQPRTPPLRQYSSGAFVTIPPPIADLFAGRDIVVTINARPSTANPSGQFSVIYLPVGSGRRDWNHFETVQQKYSDYTFEYTPPDRRNPDGAFIGIWPDTTGEDNARGSIDVLSIRVELAERRIG